MHFTSVLLPAPFSPSSAWNEPAGTVSDTSSSAASAPKRLVMLRHSRLIAVAGGGDGAGILIQFKASTTAADRDTAPNTPPCIFTILIAARWLPRSVAPVQSSSSTHS